MVKAIFFHSLSENVQLSSHHRKNARYEKKKKLPSEVNLAGDPRVHQHRQKKSRLTRRVVTCGVVECQQYVGHFRCIIHSLDELVI